MMYPPTPEPYILAGIRLPAREKRRLTALSDDGTVASDSWDHASSWYESKTPASAGQVKHKNHRF